jgi:lysozyme
LVKKAKANPNDPSILDEFMRWNKAAGKVLQGLTTRRAAEAKLYFTPCKV